MTKLLEQAILHAQSLPHNEQDAIARIVLDQLEANDQRDVPADALRALSEASRRAMESGLPVVILVDGALVRMDPSGTTMLNKLPPRSKVSVRVKQASK